MKVIAVQYLNVKRDNSFILSEDKKFDRCALIELTKLELTKSGVKVIDFSYHKKQFYLLIEYKNEIISFDLLLKNVTGAGWVDKPGIKRCQVCNIKKEQPESLGVVANKHYNLILGYYNFDSNPILIAWDPYRYLEHRTIRSCYVTVDALKRGYGKGFYEGVVSSQKCWIFLGNYFDRFLDNYIGYILKFYLKG